MPFICREKISNEMQSYVQELIRSVSQILDDAIVKVEFLIIAAFNLLIKPSAFEIQTLLITMKMFSKTNGKSLICAYTGGPLHLRKTGLSLGKDRLQSSLLFLLDLLGRAFIPLVAIYCQMSLEAFLQDGQRLITIKFNS